MGTSADDVQKHRNDIEKYLAYLTLLNPVHQGADLMLSHHEHVLWQCLNASMTNKHVMCKMIAQINFRSWYVTYARSSEGTQST